MKHRLGALLTSCAAALGAASAAPPATAAAGGTLRLITWADYAPSDLIAQFEKETGIHVEVTLSNNEEIISKLRATGGAGFDLAQPSQDRIYGPQQEFAIYKPLDLTQVKLAQITPRLLEATKANATLKGQLYALPYVWGVEGIVVNTKLAKMSDYGDLCKSEYRGRTSMRLRRPTLMAFAFAAGKDPFKLYGDFKNYTALMDQVGRTLSACKGNVRFFFDNKDQLLNGIRSGEIVGAMMWDSGGWKLNRENPDIKFIAPASGALGWIDTFAIPARGRNDAAAYAWINFCMRPDIAARISNHLGNLTAAVGAEKFLDPKLLAQFKESLPPAAYARVHWYPAIPTGLERMEGRVLDRIKAAR